MAFFVLSFGYKGTKSNFASSEKADRALSEANKKAETFLTKNGYNWRHLYAWTDGTLHKIIFVERTPLVGVTSFLYSVINKGLVNMGFDDVWLRDITGITDCFDPHKPGYDTVKEYFEKTEKANG